MSIFALPLGASVAGAAGASAAVSAAATSGPASSNSGFGSAIGDIFGKALDTAATFGTGLLGIELFKRANDAGVTTTTTTSTGSAPQPQSNANTGGSNANGGMFAGLPSWAAPVAIGVILLLVFGLLIGRS